MRLVHIADSIVSVLVLFVLARAVVVRRFLGVIAIQHPLGLLLASARQPVFLVGSAAKDVAVG
jgi:hypothetical protein